MPTARVCRLLSLAMLALLAFVPGAHAQTAQSWKEKGAFFVENVAPTAYSGAPQNWALAQDSRGVLYAANEGQVLQYDGVGWRAIALPARPTVRTLAIDNRDRVFVGAHDDFGYLAPDSLGVPRFRSLRPHVPPQWLPIGEVRSTISTPEGVYFSTPRAIFRWSERGGLRVWGIAGTSRRLGYSGGRLFVLSLDRGLDVLQGDRLVPVEGGSALIGARPAGLLPLDGNELLILTRTSGLFRTVGTSVVPFPTSADALLREAQVFGGTRLPGGELALATLRRGLLVLGPDGTLLRQVDRQDGLRDADVKSVLVDKNGDLWLGLNNGMARLLTGLPVSYFGPAEGVTGFARAVVRHNGHLFVATSDGIDVLAPPGAPGATASFRPLAGLPDYCHALLPTPHGLVAACDHGVHTVTPTGHTLLMPVESAYTLHLSTRHPDWLYVGMNNGVAVLAWKNGRWQRVGRIDGVTGEVRSLAEAKGTLWIGTVIDGLHRALVPDALGTPVARRVKTWPGTRASVFLDRGEVYVGGAADGLFRVVTENGRAFLRLDTTLTLPPAENAGFETLARTQKGAGWMNAGTFVGRFVQGAQGPAYRETISALLPTREVYALYPEPGGVLWVGTAEGLVRYEHAVHVAPPAPEALVRSVTHRGRDAVLYGGEGAVPTLQLAHDPTGVRIMYSAPGTRGAQFQTKLEGQEKQWSPWTAEAQRDFTNLNGGRYTFKVRACDAQGRTGPEAAFSFGVQPPWYRTLWAYAAYALGLVGIGALLLRLNTLRLRARNAHLEALVRARTATVEAQKKALVRQNAQIEEQAAHLRVLDEAKSRFFANISHEFRTPLTLALGPVEDLLNEQHGSLPEAVRGSLDGVRRNAYKLLRLVGRLLDLAKLESGQMALAPLWADLAAFVCGTVANFIPLAERRGIRLTCERPRAPIAALFDAEKIEDIVVNLLSNAIKATPAGGEIRISVEQAAGAAEIRVSDTGVGIEPESLSVIFDRFKQGRHALPGTTGTGIGLNLVQELVHLHGGTVAVESAVGEGSTFVVRLPLGQEGAETPGSLPLSQVRTSPEIPTPPPIAVPALAPAHALAASDRTTLLVVDDNPEIRAYVRQHLEGLYRVEEAADGDEALLTARAILPDLIVSDVMMPRLDGFGLCRALKADPALDHVPVILLTAKASGESRLEGLEAEADDYLTKPFDARELLARTRNLLASRQRLKARFGREITVRPSGVKATSADAVFLESVRATVEAHLSDADFSVDSLADAVALSPSQLGRRVKALTGMTPVQLVLQMRLARAADLLAQGAGSVSEIAYGVGFNAHAYFAQRFRGHYGVTPSAYAAGERNAEHEPAEVDQAVVVNPAP